MRRTLVDPPASFPIAVVGMALRVPGATSLDRYWRNLVEGRDCLARPTAAALRAAGVPQSLLAHPDFVRALPILDDVEGFDADFFSLTAREAELTDPAHRLFLECAWEALESAGIVPGRRGPVTGVFGGSEGNYQQQVLGRLDDSRREPALALPIRIGNTIDFLTTRVSHRLDLTGPSVGVMAACATSLVAVDLAVQSLRRGECEVALAGGATVMHPAPERLCRRHRGHALAERAPAAVRRGRRRHDLRQRRRRGRAASRSTTRSPPATRSTR